jgi:hypothetical protein
VLQILVFLDEYWSRKNGRLELGAYKDRKRLMAGLCKKGGVKYFRFHALRYAGISVMENNNVPIGSIQRILGHKNRTTTEIYLQSIGMAEREAIAVFERVNQKSQTDSHTVHKKRISHLANPLNFLGGAERDRTVDLLTASQALSQLSYSPVT